MFSGKSYIEVASCGKIARRQVGIERGSSSLYVPSPLKIPDDLIFLHQFIVKSLKNRAADVELENNFTNGMGHDI